MHHFETELSVDAAAAFHRALLGFLRSRPELSVSLTLLPGPTGTELWRLDFATAEALEAFRASRSPDRQEGGRAINATSRWTDAE